MRDWLNMILDTRTDEYNVRNLYSGSSYRLIGGGGISFDRAKNVSDLLGIVKKEIVEHSPIKSKTLTIKGRKLLVYTASIKDNTVGLFAYDANSGAFAGAKYFGNTYPYKVGKLELTSDGGLAVLCQTYVTGRFGRLCLFKLSKEQTNTL